MDENMNFAKETEACAEAEAAEAVAAEAVADAAPEAAEAVAAEAAEAVATEAEAEIKPEAAAEVMLTAEEMQMLKTAFKSYYDSIVRVVKATKQKDENVAKMTKELQKYREGYSKTLLKPICVSIISLLEDTRKTARELDDYAKDRESVEKYIKYAVSDIENMLSLYDIVCVEGQATVKGVPLNEAAKLTFPETPDTTLPTPEAVTEVEYSDGPANLTTVLEYLKIGQEKIERAYADSTMLDECVKMNAAIASTVDKNYAEVLLMPMYRQMAGFYFGTVALSEQLSGMLNDDNYKAVYSALLSYITEKAGDLLTYAGVTVIEELTDEFNFKTSKILKVVLTDNPELDKKIAQRHTNCYEFDGAVLYPAKVNVYKLA